MTGRDRMVLIGIVVLAILGGAWVMFVSPERKKAQAVDKQISTAQTALSGAESELAQARSAQASYPAAYASIVSLGKAVPASEEVPSLIYQLVSATDEKNVEFASITAGGAGSSGASASAAPAAGAAFTTLPFTFLFNGSFFDLERLFRKLDSFATRTASGEIVSSGRLLTVTSVKLAPGGTEGSKGTLGGSITASAYELPASQGLTGGATAESPTGAATPAAATTPASSSPTATATVKVNP